MSEKDGADLRVPAWPARIALPIVGFVLGVVAAVLLAWANWLLPLAVAVFAAVALPFAIVRARRNRNRLQPRFAIGGLIGLVVGAAFWTVIMIGIAPAF